MNYNHKEQLGNLEKLVDDVIYVTTLFLNNNEVYNLSILSKSYVYEDMLEYRKKVIVQKRKDKLNNLLKSRNLDHQFASTVFKRGSCVNNMCGNNRATLIRLDKPYIIPYCSYCWRFKILPRYY